MDNRQLAIDVLPLIQAVANGKQLQYLNNEWDDIELTGDIFVNPELYRIKPEPKYRPFENTKECWEEMQKHQPIGWLYNKPNDQYFYITALDNHGIVITAFDEVYYITYSDLIKRKSTFVDGTPLGINEE